MYERRVKNSKMKNFVISFLAICLILLSKASHSKARIYCVSENRSCNASFHVSCVECQPLVWFVNGTKIIPNDSIIIFSPGKHSLNSTVHKKTQTRVSFYSKKNLTLKGIESAREPSTVICSGEQSGFLFRNSLNIVVENLSFQGCGANMTDKLYGCVFFDYSFDITMSQVQIRDGRGFGLHIGDSCGNITIEKSHFKGNKDGNVVIWLRNCPAKESLKTSLKIISSPIQDGFTKHQNATGLLLKILCRNVSITLTNVTFTNNTGGNIAIYLVDFAQHTSKIWMENCHVEGGYAGSSGGGGLHLEFERNMKDDPGGGGFKCANNTDILTAINSTFTGNNAAYGGGGVWMTYYERPGTGCTVREVEFINCTFTNNTAVQGSAIQISKHKVPIYLDHNVPQFSVTLNNCVIEENGLQKKTDQHNEDGIVEMFSVEKLVIINSKFTDNKGTALMLVNSGVQFHNETAFERNSAQYGGAIKLCDSSVMYFDNDTRVTFTNNTVSLAGGAIYTGNQCLQEAPPCFFQISFKNSSNVPPIEDLAKGILYFEGNSAGIAGHAVFGGSVDGCFTDIKLNSKNNFSFYHSYELFKQIFKFSNDSEVSLVTSDPYGVCLCNNSTNKPNCSNRTTMLSGYAGQNLSLYVSAVGQTYRSIPSQLAISTRDKEGAVIRQNSYQNIFKIPFCQEVTVAVYPERNVTNVSFKIGILQINAVSESSNYYKLPKLIVDVTIKECPFPFELNASNSCDCPKHLKQHYSTSCDINTETITRPINDEDNLVWIGYLSNLSNKTVFAASEKCQESRCTLNDTPMSIHHLNVCEEGREGRVCGKCKSNYSLSLGPLDCVNTEDNCSAWRTVLLLFAFFLAGILLVCFLAVFNLTVAEGTINGLLFYANCIYANHKSTFRTSDGILYSNYQLFIAWLNLDFGIKVCFYQEMTAYQKFWLEFGFLFYLFLLGVLIVCLSRKFIWFTRLTGRNIVPVLSTMILLAYPKVVRNCIKIWNCRKDKYWSTDNSTPWIWHSDETIDCFTGKHLPLFILSVILFIAAFLYTLCLLFIQCLQRGSSWYVLRWVNRLRPFFDANTGPCRNHYQFWPGFLLFARLGLYIAFWPITNIRQRSYVLLALCIFIFFLACVSPHGVYKKWPLNLLEFSFFLNLCITSGAVAEKHSFNYTFGYTSMAIAAFTSLLILIYHSFQKLRKTRKWKRMVTEIRSKRRIIGRIANDSESLPCERSPLILHGHRGGLPTIQYDAPREPLLEYD